MVEPSATLTPTLYYSLKVPSTAFKDLSGNAFTGLTAYTAFSVSVENEATSTKDNTAPYLLTTSVGTSPNSFTASTIVMYFTETVQATTTGVVALSADAGANACSATSGPC